MKRFLILSVIFALFGCAPKEDAVLKFSVEAPHGSQIAIVCNNELIQVSLDENGEAEVVMDGVDAAYARLFFGRDFRWIYFERGDEPLIRFDAYDFKNTFVFEGSKASAVEYLKNVRLTALPDEDYALSFDEYRSRIQAKESDAVKLLKANKLSSVGRFEEMEQGRIRYSYASQLLMYPVGHMMMSGNLSYQPAPEYYDYLDSYLVENEDYVWLDEYENFIIEAAHVLDASNRDVTDLYPKTIAQMKFIADRFTNEKVRGALLHYLASAYVDRFGIDGIEELESIFYTYVKDETLLADYKAGYEKWDISRPGRLSPDFEAVDLSGKTWKVSDFHGKYLYIDLWATWCAPCRRELPHLKVLEEKFKDADIVFLGLSVDGDKSKWEEMVRSGEMSGIQLYLGPQSAFQKAYKVEGIPRFILLDKEGKIIDNDMSRPSAPETTSKLESLLIK